MAFNRQNILSPNICNHWIPTNGHPFSQTKNPTGLNGPNKNCSIATCSFLTPKYKSIPVQTGCKKVGILFDNVVYSLTDMESHVCITRTTGYMIILGILGERLLNYSYQHNEYGLIKMIIHSCDYKLGYYWFTNQFIYNFQISLIV